jgi:hypothetical protein
MFAVAGDPSFAGNPLNWNLFFARQPEPDLEFTEEELEQTANLRPSSSQKPPKKSGGRPLLWILVLVLVGGGLYVAMEPEMITDLFGPVLGESPLPPAKPPVAMQPPRSIPAPNAPASQPEPPGSMPSSPPALMPEATGTPSVPTPVPTPAPSMPTGSIPEAPPPPVAATPSPIFGEGQKVTVMLPSATPGDMVTLMQDPAGTKPGLPIRPGTTLTILDGDLQSSGWVYSVRSDEGAKGWIAENRLRLKP